MEWIFPANITIKKKKKKVYECVQKKFTRELESSGNW